MNKNGGAESNFKESLQ